MTTFFLSFLFLSQVFSLLFTTVGGLGSWEWQQMGPGSRSQLVLAPAPPLGRRSGQSVRPAPLAPSPPCWPTPRLPAPPPHPVQAYLSQMVFLLAPVMVALIARALFKWVGRAGGALPAPFPAACSATCRDLQQSACPGAPCRRPPHSHALPARLRTPFLYSSPRSPLPPGLWPALALMIAGCAMVIGSKAMAAGKLVDRHMHACLHSALVGR